MSNPSNEDIQKLAQWDTPTICNALEVVCPERRGFGYTVDPFVCFDPSLGSMVGRARTATIRACQPQPGGYKGLQDRLAWYEYVADADGPTIVVIQDIDPKPGIGAFWGEVHTHVHSGLGAAGVITNGAFRDIPDNKPGFQLLGGVVSPSHAFVHLTAHNIPVIVNGMEVQPNDIIHADQHGAVVVPEDMVRELPRGVDFMIRKEAVILDAAKKPGFNIEALKAAIKDQGEIH